MHNDHGINQISMKYRHNSNFLKKSDIKMNVAIKLIKFNFENEGIFAFNAENDA